ncbi:MAG TPA: arsenite S-adenosylmethyltransferase, partial [Acidobacteriota bacterium]|nr:arsenite S-adenosylmethyltransferase [Acidobacteriota bacterium]
MKSSEIRKAVKKIYGKAATQVQSGEVSCKASCCGFASNVNGVDPITGNLYTADERDLLPEKAVLASLGCGNPTSLA